VQWLPVEDQKPYKWFEICKNPKMTDILTEHMDFRDSFNLSDLYA
jgi:hypothetical protein